VMFGQYPRQGGQGFFPSILVIAGDKHQVLALARTVLALENQRAGQGDGR